MEKGDTCLICSGSTKFLHYQVTCCRACATFFKRSSELNRAYKCKRGTKDCSLNEKDGNRLCRYCRLQKCKQLGMKLENGKQINRANSVIPSDPKTSKEVINYNAKSAIDHFPYTRLKILENGKITVDMTPLENAVKDILKESSASPIPLSIRLTCMQQLMYGYTLYCNEFKPKEPVQVTNQLDRYALVKHHEKFLVILAKILMFCEKFAELSFNDKYTLFKTSWRIFYNLERHFTSIRYFGIEKNDYRVFQDDQLALDYNDCKFGIKDIDREIFEKVVHHWIPWRDKFVKFIMNPMKSLLLTEYELVYLLAQIIWNTQDAEGLSEEGQETAEKTAEQIANEVHNYYVYERSMENYAPRLIKLSKLMEAAKDILKTKRELFLMDRIFENLDFIIVESPLYEWKQ